MNYDEFKKNLDARYPGKFIESTDMTASSQCALVGDEIFLLVPRENSGESFWAMYQGKVIGGGKHIAEAVLQAQSQLHEQQEELKRAQADLSRLFKALSPVKDIPK